MGNFEPQRVSPLKSFTVSIFSFFTTAPMISPAIDRYYVIAALSNQNQPLRVGETRTKETLIGDLPRTLLCHFLRFRRKNTKLLLFYLFESNRIIAIILQGRKACMWNRLSGLNEMEITSRLNESSAKFRSHARLRVYKFFRWWEGWEEK